MRAATIPLALATIAAVAAAPASAQDHAEAGPDSPASIAESGQAEREEIAFEADQVEYRDEAELVVASGNVVLVRGPQSVRADTVTWNRGSGQIVAAGNIRFVDEDGNVLFTERVELTDELKAGAMENMLLVLREGGRLAADQARRQDNGIITLDQAAYTGCAVETPDGCPKRPSWRITAAKVFYNPQTGRVRYKGARLEVLGIALPLPYLSHSTSSAAGSGFLVPQLRVSRSNGVEVESSYYMRLSEARDLTLSGHLFTEVLPMVSAQYRELTEIGAYQVTGYATRSRRLSRDDAASGLRENDFRGYLDANGRFQLSPRWSLTTSTRLASDRTFLRRYDISREDRLRSTLNLERIAPDSYFSLAGWATQTLRIGENQGQVPLALPVIDYRRRIAGVLGGRVELHGNTLGIVRSDGQDTQRAFAGARWDLRRILLSGFDTTLTGLARGDVYHSDENDRTLTPRYRGEPGWQARGVALGAVDVRYPLVGSAFGGTQVLTPRFQIVASSPTRNLDVPNEDARAIDLEDSNLFALNRFPGYDRIEDGVRFTYGVEWQLERPGWRVNALVGQSYRLNDKPNLFPEGTGLSSRTSDIVGRTEIRYRDLVKLTHRFRADKDTLAVRRNEFDATIGDRRTYVEVGYLRLNRDIDSLEDLQDREELRFAGRIAFARYWSLFGSGVINLTDREEDPSFTSDGFDPLRTRLGVAYADECLEMSFLWRRDYTGTGDARKGNSFLLRFGLKNLGLP